MSSPRLAATADLPSSTPFADGASRRSLFVRMDSTPNPDSMKFVPEGETVLPEEFGTGIHFSTIKDAKGSKLVRRLLKIDPVTDVFLGRDFISVNKQEEVDWQVLRPLVLNAIMDEMASGEPVITEAVSASDTAITEDDSEVVALIKELLETRIRPAVQEDGGDIMFKGFDEDTGIVKLQMAGSCVGCPSSTLTLKQGVENMLMHYITEVEGIEQVFDEELIEVNNEAFESLEEKLRAAGVEP